MHLKKIRLLFAFKIKKNNKKLSLLICVWNLKKLIEAEFLWNTRTWLPGWRLGGMGKIFKDQKMQIWSYLKWISLEFIYSMRILVNNPVMYTENLLRVHSKCSHKEKINAFKGKFIKLEKHLISSKGRHCLYQWWR